MKRSAVFIFAGLLWLCTAIATGAFGQAQKPFPYRLTKADIPKGFTLAGPFSKADKQLSLSANKGIVTDKKLIELGLYEHVDTRLINRVFVASYIPSKHAENGLIVFIVEYKNQMARKREQAKLPHDAEGYYLVKDNYLFSIGADANDYPKQVRQLVSKLKARWHLTSIN